MGYKNINKTLDDFRNRLNNLTKRLEARHKVLLTQVKARDVADIKFYNQDLVDKQWREANE